MAFLEMAYKTYADVRLQRLEEVEHLFKLEMALWVMLSFMQALEL